MAGGEKDASRRFALANDVAGSRCAQDTVMSDQDLPHAIGCSNLGNQLDHLGVVVPAIPSDNEEASICALWDGE